MEHSYSLPWKHSPTGESMEMPKENGTGVDAFRERQALLRKLVSLFANAVTQCSCLPVDEPYSVTTDSADEAMLAEAALTISRELGVRISPARLGAMMSDGRMNIPAVMAALCAEIRRLVAECDRFKVVLENLSQGVYMFDKDARLVVWNSKSNSLLEFPDGFLREGITLEELARFNAARGDYGDGPEVEEFVNRVIEGGKNPVEHRFERTRPNGLVLEVFGKPLPYGGFLSTFSDITERKRAELALKKANDELEHKIEERTRELRESQERFRQMLDSSTDWYWETDAEHRFTYISDRFYMLTKYAPDDILGRGRWEVRGVLSISEPNGNVELLRTEMEACRSFRNIDYLLRRDDGEEMIVRTSGQPYFSESGVFLGYRGTATDATAMAAAQQELLRADKFAALGSLVAGVAHEINTPIGIGLTAATYMEEKAGDVLAQLAAEELKRSELEHFVQTVVEVSSSLATNLRQAAMQVRSFKQVAVDQSTDATRTFNLANYIDEVLSSLSPRLKRTQHHIEVSCPPGLDVSCNPGKLSQMLTNLVINSLTHGFENKAEGVIAIEATATTSGGLSLVFSDDGKGVPAMLHRNIFEPFFTTRRGKGGSGLGLHIVYNLVASMGGVIEFNSAEGKGVRFAISLPDIVMDASHVKPATH